jgi:hypothetical protein
LLNQAIQIVFSAAGRKKTRDHNFAAQSSCGRGNMNTFSTRPAPTPADAINFAPIQMIDGHSHIQCRVH